jgi:N-acetylglutamate synthase-like GNAT family acetyltransferase
MRTIRKAQTADLASVAGLLRRSDLPLQGLETAGLELFVAEEERRVVGAVALETYSPYALIRSLVVDPRERTKGHGGALLRHAVQHARDQRLTTLYCLTTTIPDWLARLGFEEIPRDQIARPVHQSAELRGACPASARAFRLRLRSEAANPTISLQNRPNPTTRF